MKFMARHMAAAAVALMGLGGAAAEASVVYTDGATDLTGEYRGTETLTVTFDAVGGTSDISFDLFGTSSLDGYGNGWDDLFSISLNGVTVFEGYFNLGGGGTDYILTDTLGWSASVVTGGLWLGGIATISGLVELLAGENVFTVTFSSPGANNGGAQSLSDESWALNNLDITAQVAPVPLPASLPLLGLGLAGLGLISRKKARKSV